MSDHRDWQHPAEHAATHSRGFIMNPPPLAKRIVLLTATVSLLTSFAVLFVAIPKGIDEYVEKPEPTTTVPLVNTSSVPSLGQISMNGHKSCAFEALPGVWVTSSDPVGDIANASLSVNGVEQKIDIFHSQEVPELVVAAANAKSLPRTSEFGNLSVNLSHLQQATVVGCVNNLAMTLQKSATQFANKEEMPVFVSGEVEGLAVVFDTDHSLMGVVYEHNGGQRFITTQVIAQLINTAN